VCVCVFSYVCPYFTGLQEHTEQKGDSARIDVDEAVDEQDDIEDPFQPDAVR